MFAITEVSLKDLYTIIKEFKDVPYEGYARNRSTHIRTDSYFYLERNIEKFMMRNSRGLLRTQNMSTQKMRNSKMSTEKFLICMSVLRTRANQKGSTQTRADQKVLTPTRVLWKRVNKKASTKWI